jgi:hypothetical protein
VGDLGSLRQDWWSIRDDVDIPNKGECPSRSSASEEPDIGSMGRGAPKPETRHLLPQDSGQTGLYPLATTGRLCRSRAGQQGQSPKTGKRTATDLVQRTPVGRKGDQEYLCSHVVRNHPSCQTTDRSITRYTIWSLCSTLYRTPNVAVVRRDRYPRVHFEWDKLSPKIYSKVNRVRRVPCPARRDD